LSVGTFVGIVSLLLALIRDCESEGIQYSCEKSQLYMK
jgi:hypothetical protein